MSKGAGSTGVATATGGRTATRTADGVTYAKSDRAVRDGDVAIRVNVAQLDKAWKKDEGFHIPRGGEKGGDKGKLANARAYVQKPTNGPVKMPQVHYNAKTGTASITDGRHRTAAVRDLGKTSIWITVSRGQARSAKRDLS